MWRKARRKRSPSLGERLGFGSDERVAVVHCDDIGMCHAANEGAFEALDRGPATCGSIMVPCPWFREAADMAGARPEADLGVHLTLNAEWPHYRWGPVVGARAVPSLVDDQGFFPRTTGEVLERARLEDVETELRAQIERALEAGIDVTHIDSHMGTVFMPPFVAIYAKLAREFRLPAFAVWPDRKALDFLGGGVNAVYDEVLGGLEADGWPIFDGWDAQSLHFAPDAGDAHNRERIAGLKAGVSYLICHPAKGGEELSAITEDAHMRDFERGFYGGEAGRREVDAAGVRTLGMRALRDLVRS